MNLVQRVAKNTLSLILASVISMVLGLFYGIYTARYLGPERYGTISFAIAFIGLFSVLTDIGIQQLALREIARDKSLVGKYLGNIAVLKVFLTIITFGLIALTINLLKYPDPTVKVVYLIALSTVLSAFSGMFNSVFQAFEKMEYSSIGSILNSASMLAGGLLAIYYGLSIMGFALIYVFSNAIGLIYNIIIARRLGITPRLQVDYGFIKSLVRRALPFGIGGLFLVYYVWIARVMLSVMVNNEAVGYYSAAYNLMGSLNFVPSAFVASLFPLMAILYKGSDKSLDKVFRIGIKYMYMLALPMAVGVTLLGKEIITLIYGPKFLPSVMALDILIWAEFFIFIDVLLGQMLFSINRERITMINAGIGAAINIGLNLVLIPRMGIYVFSNAIGLIYNVIIARRLGITPRLQVDYGFIKSLVRRALPFGIGGFFLVYYIWIARVMLSMMVNNEAVGYYSAAYNLMSSLNFVPSAFVASLFPLMAMFFKGSDKSLDKVFRIGIKYIYMLALPIAVGVTLLDKEIIALIYGSKFLPSAMALEILIWAEFFIFIDVLLSQMLFSINKENITMINAGLGAALNIGLNLVLIPRLGIEGSALATLATEFYFFVISFIVLKRYGHSVNLRNLLFKPLIATSIMALFITTFSRLHLFMLIPMSAALYFAILYLIRYVSDEDIKLIKQALAIRKLRSAA